IPIVFTNVADPVSQGFVSNLAHPGGNITGFANLEASIAGKWVDLLKQMAPSITRVVFIFNPDSSPQSRLFISTAQDAGRSLGVEVIAAETKSFDEIAATLARLALESKVGLVFPPDISTFLHVEMVVAAAARHQLPAIYAGEQ